MLSSLQSHIIYTRDKATIPRSSSLKRRAVFAMSMTWSTLSGQQATDLATLPMSADNLESPLLIIGGDMEILVMSRGEAG